MSTATLTPRRSALVEDAAFMADTGESLVGAARRLGLAPDSLAIYLRRVGRADIAHTLRARDPLRLRDHRNEDPR